MDKEDVKKLRTELGEGRRQWRRDNIAKEAKATSEAYEALSPVEDDELQSDWKKLITTAKIRFPEHLALRFQLRPQQRLVAIAHLLGWSAEKISEASAIPKRTIYSWLSHQVVQDFAAAFEYHNGTKDAKELVDKEQYNSLQVLKELRDDPTISPTTRKDIAIWFFETKYGKAKEHREVTGVNLKELTEQLMKKRQDSESATLLNELDKNAETDTIR